MSTATRTTAQLPPAARIALRNLELQLTVAPEIVRAVTQYELAGLHAAALASIAATGRMTDLDADSLAAAEDLMAGSRATLAAAGRLDLIEAA